MRPWIQPWSPFNAAFRRHLREIEVGLEGFATARFSIAGDDVLRPRRVADAPAGHRVGLRHAVQYHRARIQVGQAFRMLANFASVSAMCSYSVESWRSGCRDACAAPRPAPSVLPNVYTRRTGCSGVITTILVFWRDRRLPVRGGHPETKTWLPRNAASTITGLPSAMITISG